MYKQLLFISVWGFLAFDAFAEKVSFVEVKDNIVYFSTDQAINQPVPECVLEPSKYLWTINLSTLQGQGQYSTLLLAINRNISIQIEPSGICHDVVGVESLKKITLVVE